MHIYNEVYIGLPRPLNVGDIVVICGQMDPRDEQPKVNVTQVLSLPEAHEQLLRELVLCICRARSGRSRRGGRNCASW